MKEVDWQRRLAANVREQGGYARKWATQFSVGVPDLVIVHPSIDVAFVEVKRIVQMTPLSFKGGELMARQYAELQMLHHAGAFAAVLYVIEYLSKKRAIWCQEITASIAKKPQKEFLASLEHSAQHAWPISVVDQLKNLKGEQK